MDVAQIPGWATWIVGLEGDGLWVSRLSFVWLRSRKDWTGLEVAGSLVEVRARISVIRLVCSYALWDSMAWISLLLKCCG